MNNSYIPNTSAIPNVLFDYWMQKLSPAEFKVLMCIARKTYGWHKDVDVISIKQIEKMTGLSRKGIIKNIEVLMSHNLLIKIKSKTEDGDDAANRYTINVNCMGGGSELSTPGVVNSVHQGGSVLSTPTKERLNTKENIQNKSPPIPPQKNGAKPQEAKASENDLNKPPEEKPKRNRKPSDFSPKVREVTQMMLDSLVRTKPDYVAPKNLSAFMTHVDYLLRLDKRDPGKILDVFNWALADYFWCDKMFTNNPAEYLRMKFDKLDMKMNAKPAPKSPRKFAPCSDDQAAFEKMEEMRSRAL